MSSFRSRTALQLHFYFGKMHCILFPVNAPGLYRMHGYVNELQITQRGSRFWSCLQNGQRLKNAQLQLRGFTVCVQSNAVGSSEGRMALYHFS